MMKLLKRLLSWTLVPYFVLLCVIYCCLSFRNSDKRFAVQCRIDRFVRWNDTVLMGKDGNK